MMQRGGVYRAAECEVWQQQQVPVALSAAAVAAVVPSELL
jgi:hypothetical protein